MLLGQETGDFDPLALAPTLIYRSDPLHPNSDTGESYHHLKYFDTAPELQGIYGRAARYSVGQMLPNWQHGWVHNTLDPPQLADTPEMLIATTMLNCARVVQREAVFVQRGGGYDVRPMEDAEFAYMTSREVLMIEGGWQPDGGRFYRNRIGYAFANFAVNYALQTGEIPLGAAEEFMVTADPERSHELGNLLVGEAVKMVVEEVRPFYNEAVRRDMVPSGMPDLQAVARKLFINDRYADYHEVVKERLAEVIEL